MPAQASGFLGTLVHMCWSLPILVLAFQSLVVGEPIIPLLLIKRYAVLCLDLVDFRRQIKIWYLSLKCYTDPRLFCF